MPRLRERSATERYEIGIPEVGMPSPRLQAPVTEESFGASTGKAIGNLAGPLNKWAVAIAAREDEYDKSKVEWANNEYQKWLLDYTNNPETGTFNARKGENAIGESSVLRDFDRDSLKKKDELATRHKMNKRQLQLWNQIAPRTALPYYEQTQNHEQKEYENFKQENFETFNANSLNAILAAPDNPLVMQTYTEQLDGYMQVEYSHVSKETFKKMYDTQVSAMEMQRLSSIAVQDPLVAFDLMTKSQYLTAQDRTALKKTLQGEVDTVKRQQAAASYFQKYGDDLTSAYLAIRRENPGSKGEGIAQSYGELVGESDATEVRVRAETNRRQQEFADNLWNETLGSGIPIKAADLKRALDNGDISPSQYRNFMNNNRNMMNKDGVIKALMNDPDIDFMSMTYDEQTDAVMEAMHITQDMRDQVNAELNSGILNGTTNVDRIRFAESQGYISKEEMNNKIDILNGMDSSLRTLGTNEKADMEATLRKLFSGDAALPRNVDDLVKDAMNLYNTPFLALSADRNNTTFPEKLAELKTNILEQVYSNYKGKLSEGNSRRIAIEENYAVIKPTLGEVTYYEPTFTLTDVDLPNEYTDPGYLNNPVIIENPIIAAVSGGREAVPGGDNGKPRAGDANSGYSYDVPAPEGSDIMGYALPFPMKVEQAYHSKDGGNMKVYRGTTATGDVVEMRYLHLQTLEGDQIGDIMSPTSNVGYVGNTGRSTGPHLHFDVKVNGKGVEDPAKFIRYLIQQYHEQRVFGINQTASQQLQRTTNLRNTLR